ncbi:MAG: cell shape determination protein CcmA [Myxococcales bacterium]|nr:cell shape determination protein CcmA [Myxococcales bacterium]
MRPPAGAPRGVASLFATASFVVACSGSTEPPVGVAAISPAQAFNDAEVSVIIEGGPFRPAYDIDTTARNAVTNPGAFSAVLSPSEGDGPRLAVETLTWLNTSELAAILPKGLARGQFDVQVRDPRGTVGIRPNGFTSLGHDDEPPSVTIFEPSDGVVVNVGAEVPVAYGADDRRGQLATMVWTALDAAGDIASGTCAVEPGVAKNTCRFVFIAPKLEQSDVVTVHVEARDAVGNVGGAESKIVVAPAPVATDVAPRLGPATGGTEVVVTGAQFVVGTEVLVDGLPLDPGGGAFVSAQMLKGRTPPHEPGVVPVSVRSGALEAAAGTFEFVGKPIVLAVSPTMGPLAGDIAVVLAGRNFRAGNGKDDGGTKIEFGGPDGRASLICLDVINSNRITGVLPAGSGAASIFASDAIGGMSEFPLAFNYVGDDSPDAGVAPTCPKAGAGGASGASGATP